MKEKRFPRIMIYMNIDELRNNSQTLFHQPISDWQAKLLYIYERELQEWNVKINLTAISDSEGIRSKHFLDSISMLPTIREADTKRVIDIGTGAGFPGIVLKLFMPDIQLTLVESVGKKLQFCEHVCKELGIKGVKFSNARAEELGQDNDHREKYDLAVARAVANMPVLAEYLIPLVTVGGRVIAQKGETGPAEVQRADYAIQLLGGRLRQIKPITLPEIVEDRYLVVIDKVAATHDKYPRRVGIPAKRPLQEE